MPLTTYRNDPSWEDLRALRCGCHGCQQPAATTFYICALGAYVPVCHAHDLIINRAVLAAITTTEEVCQLIARYINQEKVDPTEDTASHSSHLQGSSTPPVSLHPQTSHSPAQSAEQSWSAVAASPPPSVSEQSLSYSPYTWYFASNPGKGP